MKILINQVKYLEKFVCLTNALQDVSGIQVNVVTGQLKDDVLIYLKPDIVVHNSQDNVDFLSKRKILGIWLDSGANGPQSINIDDLGPTIDLSLFNNVQVKDKYKCDIVFFGDVSVFDNELFEYANGEYSLRIFNNIPLNLPFYCGSLPRQEYPSAYRSAVCCPWSVKEDRSRLFEIIKSGGNPVVYDPEKNGFHSRLQYILESKKQGIEVPPAEFCKKGELESSYNINRLGLALKNIGYEKLGNAVLKGSL